MGPFATAAIAAGTTALGGILGRSSGPSVQEQMRKQREQGEKGYRDRLRNMRKYSRQSGFNPLTLLKAGGGQTQMPTMPAAQSPFTARAALGEAIKTFGGTYAQDAAQRATEDRQNEEWTRRYDYSYQDVSGVPKGPSRAPSLAAPETRFSGSSGNFPTVDPHGIQPENTRVLSGPYRDRYVLGVDGAYYLTPKGTSPQELYESLTGSVLGETASMYALVKDMADGTVDPDDIGLTRVTWNPDTGEITGTRPKGATRSWEHGQTPSMPIDVMGRPTVNPNPMLGERGRQHPLRTRLDTWKLGSYAHRF